MNFLNEYMEATKNSESPRSFWLWSGIFTIVAALERRVWLEFGTTPLYPSIYLLIVAEPGKCRKDPPNRLSKRLLDRAGVFLAADSFTGRAFTKTIVKVGKECAPFFYDGKECPQTPLAAVSGELSDIMVDPQVVGKLTRLYDAPKKWSYVTSGEGADDLSHFAVSIYANTTPRYLSEQLPKGAVGGGFTSRFIIVYESEKHQWVTLPPKIPEATINKLVMLLHDIKKVCGPIEFPESSEAYKIFNEWYQGFKDRNDELYLAQAVQPNINRLHTSALKVAMALHFSNELKSRKLSADDVSGAIKLVESALKSASTCFKARGRNNIGTDIQTLMMQIDLLTAKNKKAEFSELLHLNFARITRVELRELLGTVVDMGYAKVVYDTTGTGAESYISTRT